MKPLTIEYDDVRLCNCSLCGDELLGKTMQGHILPTEFDLHEFVYEYWPRTIGTLYMPQPLCETCFLSNQTFPTMWPKSYKQRVLPFFPDEDNPGFENIVRLIEDDHNRNLID